MKFLKTVKLLTIFWDPAIQLASSNKFMREETLGEIKHYKSQSILRQITRREELVAMVLAIKYEFGKLGVIIMQMGTKTYLCEKNT